MSRCGVCTRVSERMNTDAPQPLCLAATSPLRASPTPSSCHFHFGFCPNYEYSLSLCSRFVTGVDGTLCGWGAGGRLEPTSPVFIPSLIHTRM
jgi:hypothetical protein